MENNKDKLIQYCTCPICKAKVELEYIKKSSHNLINYNIRVEKGCSHFQEGEYLNENYARLINSLLQNRQADYDKLVESRAKRKLQEMGLNREDIKGLF